MKTTKAFEAYWRNAEVGVNLPEIPRLYGQLKRIAWRAWQAGRKSVSGGKK